MSSAANHTLWLAKLPAEIAAKVGRSERTVERILQRIRKTWSREASP